MMRVLLLHSEPLVADVVAAMLRGRGYEVALAAGAPDAVLRCSRHEADIVFIDLRTPRETPVQDVVALLRRADPALAILCAEDGPGEPSSPGALGLHRPYSVAAVAKLFGALFESREPAEAMAPGTLQGLTSGGRSAPGSAALSP